MTEGEWEEEETVVGDVNRHGGKWCHAATCP